MKLSMGVLTITTIIMMMIMCTSVHSLDIRAPDEDDLLVPPKHSTHPADSPDVVNKITDEAIDYKTSTTLTSTSQKKADTFLHAASGTDNCFYSHLDKCGSCVLDNGCGFCAEGGPHVHGRCMAGTKKGPKKYTGCKVWHYTVCTLHVKGPEYVPAPPPKRKVIIPKPLITTPNKPVELLPMNETKLSPWRVKRDEEETKPTTSTKTPAKKIKQVIIPKTISTPKQKISRPHVKLDFKMTDYIKTIAMEEKKIHADLEHEKEVAIDNSKPEGHDDKADEGMEELKNEIYSDEKRSVRERRKKLEEDWKRQWMTKQKLSIEHQTNNDINDERSALKSVWENAPSQIPPEAMVEPGTSWKNVQNKTKVLNKLHYKRGFITNKKYMNIHGPNWQDSNNVDHLHLGLGITGINGKELMKKMAEKKKKSLRRRL